MKKILIAFLMMLSVVAVNAQQNCGEVDCPGRCGRFVDADGDGFCDHGRLSQPAKAEPEKKVEPQPAKAEPAKKVETESTKVQTTATEESDNKEESAIEDNAVPENNTANADTVAPAASAPAQATKSKSPYPVYHILIALLLVYGVSIFLVKKGVWQKATHRKVWNIALTATFLVSCLLGVLLAIFIHHGYYPQTYVDFLHIHVWFGIAMTIIALFHALWHINYYKAIFKSK